MTVATTRTAATTPRTTRLSAPPDRLVAAEGDPAAFWRWMWASVRPVLGYVFVALGFIALALGWYGVSGEALVAKQLPYLISGGLVGLAFIGLGARFMLIEDLRRDSGRLDRLERMVADLHELLLTAVTERDSEATATSANGAAPDRFLVLPNASTYHAPGCAMVEGKSGVSRLRPATIAKRGLEPCPLCDPDPVEL